MAVESVDARLMKTDPCDIVGAIEPARAMVRKMHQSLGWAIGSDATASPLAAGVLHPFVMRPDVAANSMSGSPRVVAINALMLKRTKLAETRQPGKDVFDKVAGAAAAATQPA